MSIASNLAKAASNITDTGLPRQSAFSASSVGHSVTQYDSYGSLPREGLIAGQQAFTLADNTLFITDGILWYRTAVVNRAPYITSITDDSANISPFVFDGTDPIIITMIAGDSDTWETLTYSYTADSDFSGLATISQNNNIFTITPYSIDSASVTTSNITFSVTDGQNVTASALQNFSILITPEDVSPILITTAAVVDGYNSDAIGDYYAHSTQIIDKNRVLAGAPHGEASATLSTGFIALVSKTNTSLPWSDANTTASISYGTNVASNSQMGYKLSISGDKSVAASVAWQDNNNQSSIQMFGISGNTLTALSEVTTGSVSIYLGGATTSAGPYLTYDASKMIVPTYNQGFVWFSRSGNTWGQNSHVSNVYQGTKPNRFGAYTKCFEHQQTNNVYILEGSNYGGDGIIYNYVGLASNNVVYARTAITLPNTNFFGPYIRWVDEFTFLIPENTTNKVHEYKRAGSLTDGAATVSNNSWSLNHTYTLPTELGTNTGAMNWGEWQPEINAIIIRQSAKVHAIRFANQQAAEILWSVDIPDGNVGTAIDDMSDGWFEDGIFVLGDHDIFNTYDGNLYIWDTNQ